MKLFFTRTRNTVVQVIQPITEVFDVTKVERSGSGFLTSTQTAWTCHHCRERIRNLRSRGDAGIEPYPMAVWKFTGVSTDAAWAFLYLCAEHFRKMRDGQQEPPQESMTMGEIFNEAFDDVPDAQPGPWITTRPRA